MNRIIEDNFNIMCGEIEELSEQEYADRMKTLQQLEMEKWIK